MHVDLAALVETVARRAPGWYPDLHWTGSPVLERRMDRPQSVLLRIRVATSAHAPTVLVKVGFPAGGALADRPRLNVAAELERRHEWEFAALRALHQDLDERPQPGLWAVAALDHMPEHRAIVMEYRPEPTLRRLMSPLRPRRPPDLTLRSVGALLRRFHDAGEHLGDASVRLSPDQALGDLRRFARFVGERSRHRWIVAAVDRAARVVERALPAELTLAVSHADFSPRNVLVSGQQAVALIDPLAARHAPVYEDLATFLVDLRVSGWQAMTAGRSVPAATIDRWERELLAGYGRSAPAAGAQLLIARWLVLLDRWSATIARSARRGAAGGALDLMTARRVALEARRLALEVGGGA